MDTEEDDEIDIAVLRIDVTATAEYDEEETAEGSVYDY
jgi:dipeptidase D